MTLYCETMPCYRINANHTSVQRERVASLNKHKNEGKTVSNKAMEGERGRYCNYFLTSTLVFVSLLAQITPVDGKPVSCPSNSISWRNKSTQVIVACTSCPPCIPSEEYSIACGDTVDIGTDGTCRSCPYDTYSDSFDTTQCHHCTKCTNRIYKQNCTASQNAICGPCVEGYYYNRHISSCIPVEKPLTIQPSPHLTVPTKPIATEKVGTTQSHWTSDERNVTTHSTKPIATEKVLTTQSHWTSDERNVTTPITGSTLAKKDLPSRGTSQGNDSSSNTWFIISFVLICLVLMILSTVVVSKICRDYNWCKRHKRSCGYSPNEEPAAKLMIDHNPQEHLVLLKDFIHNSLTEAEKVYKFLEVRKNGTWDFERVGRRWKIEREDLLALKRENQVPNGSAGKSLCEKIMAENDQAITVLQFAHSLKDINIDAYNVLKKHFTVPLARQEC